MGGCLDTLGSHPLAYECMGECKALWGIVKVLDKCYLSAVHSQWRFGLRVWWWWVLCGVKRCPLSNGGAGGRGGSHHFCHCFANWADHSPHNLSARVIDVAHAIRDSKRGTKEKQAQFWVICSHLSFITTDISLNRHRYSKNINLFWYEK